MGGREGRRKGRKERGGITLTDTPLCGVILESDLIPISPRRDLVEVVSGVCLMFE